MDEPYYGICPFCFHQFSNANDLINFHDYMCSHIYTLQFGFFNSKCLHSSLVLLVLFFMCRLEDFEEVPVNTVHTLPLVQFLLSLAYSLYSLKHHNDFVCVFLQVFKALKCQLCKLHCHIAKSIGCMLASVAPQYQMSHHISI